MSLAALIQKGGLRAAELATVATGATEPLEHGRTVARVATVAGVASPVNSIHDRIQDRQPLNGARVVREVRDGEQLRAVLIYSSILGTNVWVIADSTFQPADPLAVFYECELAELATKSPDTLREIHRYKLAYPGCRIIQEGPEAAE